MLALETHAHYLAVHTGFNGSQGNHLEQFIKDLTGDDGKEVVKESVSLSDIVAMGKQLQADESACPDGSLKAEREANERAIMDLFAKHRQPKP